ncbi:MAG: hypothetical protein FWG68_11965 [Defluviitaleaceae bacterium]|nr:hypothetical protein [Defluviitaleaceae bacterium]
MKRRKKQTTLGEDLLEALKEIREYLDGDFPLKTTFITTDAENNIIHRETKTMTLKEKLAAKEKLAEHEKIREEIWAALSDIDEVVLQAFPDELEHAKANLDVKTPTMIVDRSYWQNPQGDFTVVPFEEPKEIPI